MKIALQLSGRLKFTELSLSTMINHIIAPLRPDVFCSFWTPIHANTAIEYEKHLQPILCEYENQTLIRPYLDLDFPADVYPNLPSMSYKFHRSSMLRQTWEHKTGQKYDVVIQARSDVAFFEPMDLSRCQLSLDENAILCQLYGHQFKYIVDHIDPHMQDNFYLGPRDLVDQANTAYWYLRAQAKSWEKEKLYHYLSCTEVLQSKIWNDLGIPIKNLPGQTQYGCFAYDVDRSDSTWR